MDDSLKWVIIGKANKIYNSKREPQSDEKFLRRKEQIDKQYAEAKKNYFLTLEEKYNSEADNDFWIYIESLYNFKI